MAKLIIRLGAEEWEAELTAEVSSIGRSGECTIPIRHKSLSRRHCEVRRGEKGFVLRDCESLNGTVVNGKKITGEHTLEAGERIDVGIAHVYFERKSERAAKAPAAAVGAPAAEPVVVPVVEAEGHPATYAAWSRRGAGAGRVLAISLALAGLAAAALGARALLAPSGPPPDADNLLRDANASFEAAAPEGIPPGWSIPIGTQTRVWVEKGGDAKEGRQYLVIEKAPVPEEFVLGCASETLLEARPDVVYAAQGWVRTQSLKGIAALRGVVRAAKSGLVLAQYHSAPVQGTADWAPVGFEFVAPRGSKIALECVVAGAEGRAQFDALRVVERAGATLADSAAFFDFRRFKAIVQPGGVFHLMYKQEGEPDKWVLAHARLRLRSPHGAADQGFVAGAPPPPAPPSRDKASGAVTLQTHVLHPSTLQWVPVKQTLEETEREFRIGYEIAGGGARAEDELGLEVTSPLADAGATARVETDAGDRPADLADLAASSVRRFLWRSGEIACTVRYPYAVAIAGGRRAGVLRLEQSVGVGRARAEAGDASAAPGAGAAAGPGGATAALFGLGLTLTLQRELGSLQSALERAAAADAQGRLGEALSTYRRIVEEPLAKQNVGIVKDAERRLRETEAKLKQAQADVRRAIAAARLLADPAAVAEAERRVDDLYQRCQGSPFDQDDADRLRASLDAIRAQISGDTSRDPAAATLRLAEFHVNRGDADLGRTLLEHILKHYKSTPLAQEAEQLKVKLDAATEGAQPQGKGGNGGN